VEDLLVTGDERRVRVSGLIVRAGGIRFRYGATLSPDWRLQCVRFAALSEDRSIGWGVTIGDDGVWRNDAHQELAHYAGCIGVDLTGTPATTSLLLRRVTLAVGESTDVAVMHVTVPDMKAERRARRFTRISENQYRCDDCGDAPSAAADSGEGIAHCFALDEDGLVVDWPGRFRRIWTSDPQAAALDAQRIIAEFESHNDVT